jgi:hypothetical protein
MSEIKVNKISPKQTCTQLTLGDSGDTIIIPAGATITNNGTATGFGRTGTVNWDTTPKTTTVTAVSGVGYFVNTTSGGITVNLPVGTAGSIVAVSDYANISATNAITITPNGTDKIDGVNASYYLSTNGAAITLIYVDATRGWKDVYDSTLNAVGLVPTFIAATGGTVLTCGNYKTHVFTGPGTFTVSNAGNAGGSNSVEYLVVAGGGGAGRSGGGGGAGGFRSYSINPPASPLNGSAIPVSVTGYPISIGGGGVGGTLDSTVQPATSGTPTTALGLTSTGGGGGANYTTPTGALSGGSGGGAGVAVAGSSGGTGNTPPTSPSQGNNGGSQAGGPGRSAGGGGGAGASGTPGTLNAGACGGVGSYIATTFIGPTSPSYGEAGPIPGVRYFAGGGGGSRCTGPSTASLGGAGGGGAGGNNAGGTPQSGDVNTGGGAGAGNCSNGSGGGSGIVMIKYKFQ